MLPRRTRATARRQGSTEEGREAACRCHAARRARSLVPGLGDLRRRLPADCHTQGLPRIPAPARRTNPDAASRHSGCSRRGSLALANSRRWTGGSMWCWPPSSQRSCWRTRPVPPPGEFPASGAGWRRLAWKRHACRPAAMLLPSPCPAGGVPRQWSGSSTGLRRAPCRPRSDPVAVAYPSSPLVRLLYSAGNPT